MHTPHAPPTHPLAHASCRVALCRSGRVAPRRVTTCRSCPFCSYSVMPCRDVLCGEKRDRAALIPLFVIARYRWFSFLRPSPFHLLFLQPRLPSFVCRPMSSTGTSLRTWGRPVQLLTLLFVPGCCLLGVLLSSLLVSCAVLARCLVALAICMYASVFCFALLLPSLFVSGSFVRVLLYVSSHV